MVSLFNFYQLGNSFFQSNNFIDWTHSWMITVRVSDLAKLVEQLRKAGVKVSLDEQARPKGRFARLDDQEGNPLELWEPKC